MRPSLWVIADTVASLQGTSIVASIGNISAVRDVNMLCAKIDRAGTLVGTRNATYLASRTSGALAQVDTLDLRNSNLTELLNVHVKTLIDCPSRLHVDTRLRMTNSSYDQLVLNDGPGC